MTSYLPLIPFIIAWFCLIAGPPAILIGAIQRWWHTSPRISAPAWRTYLAIAAIVLVGFSELLWIVAGVWLDMGGGGSGYTVFPWFARLGFFAAPAGLLASLIGKGTLRLPACIAAVVVMLLWIAMGSVD